MPKPSSARGVVMNTRILGMPALQRTMDGVAADLVAARLPAELAAGEPIKEKWRSLVPVLDRNYQESLAVGPTSKGAAVGTTWLASVPREEQPVLYSKRLEFGTSGTKAQPSARPAAQAAKAAAKAAGEAEFRTALRGSVRKRRVRGVPTT